MQFTREKRRWYSSRNNHDRKTTPNDPGPWQSWYAAIDWVPVQFQPNPEATAALPAESQESNVVPPSIDHEIDVDVCAVALDAEARKHLILLANSIEVRLESLAEEATYDEFDFSRRWAAHVEDRVEAINLAAAALRELAYGSNPSTQKKPRI